MENRTYTRQQVIDILEEIVGKTLGQADKNKVFDGVVDIIKKTGIAGDVIEQSVFGYKPNTEQEPDIIVDEKEVEIKTTGLKRTKGKKAKEYPIEAKEPMSITAVSPDKIIHEEFLTSNLWHKLEYMILVYYLYDSETTVPAIGYADFPIQGYQFHEFNDLDKKTIEKDWKVVRDYIRSLQSLDDPTVEYPKISKLRDKMMYMDTAPKYPNPPRFRLKRKVVTAIAQEYLGKDFEILEAEYQFTSYEELDRILRNFSNKYVGKSIEEIAQIIGITLKYNDDGVVDKKINEQILTSAFGVKTGKLREIDTFAKMGTIPKTITLTSKGGRTEDTKFDTIDFVEWSDPTVTFEESSIYEFFSNQTFLFSIFEEPYDKSPLEQNIFKGFKRLSFSEEFIYEHVQKTWDDVRNLLMNDKFEVTEERDKNGKVIINKKTGTVREKTNFPKSKDYLIFLRGTGTDSTKKTLNLKGYQIYQQQFWIKGSALVDMLESVDFI
jgi:hypothetical protein